MLDNERWFTQECLSETDAMLKTADKRIKDGSQKCLVWDERYPHEGWDETPCPMSSRFWTMNVVHCAAFAQRLKKHWISRPPWKWLLILASEVSPKRRVFKSLGDFQRLCS